jgi:hypothetical protein
MVPSKDEEPFRILGFLITGRERMPSLVAWIEGCGDLEVVMARGIASGRRSPEIASDLRGRPAPDFLIGKPLLLIDLAAGGTTNGTWGVFTPLMGTIAFAISLRPQLAIIPKWITDKLSAPDDQTEGGQA